MRIELATAVGLSVLMLAWGGPLPTAGNQQVPSFIGIDAVSPVTLPDGSAGCDVTISASNTGKSNLKIVSTSQVRAKPSFSPSYGTWKKLWTSNQFIKPGQKWSSVVRLDFGCSYRRQYRFTVGYPSTGEKAFTYPSSGNTSSEQVGLGNLYTKFFD